MGHVGNHNGHTRAAAPTGFWSWCSLGKAFLLVVWASARGTCFGVLLNTQLSWCPPPEPQMFKGRKGPKVPVASMAVPPQNPKVLVVHSWGLALSFGKEKYKLTFSKQDVWTTHTIYSQMHQQMFSTPAGGLNLCPTPSISGFQGQQAPKISHVPCQNDLL